MDAATIPAHRRLIRARHAHRLADVLRWALAITFAWSAGAKVVALESFRNTLFDTGFVPADWLGPVSVAIPCCEFALAVWLAAGIARSAGLLAAAFLGACFAAFHAFLLLRGELIPCLCMLNNPILTARPQAHRIMLAVSLAIFFASAAALLLPLWPRCSAPGTCDQNACDGRANP